MPLNIRRGLRKLEFESGAGREGSAGEALVEFVTQSPLERGATACVPLGRRDGVLREVVGIVQLVESKELGDKQREYRYRIRGTVSRAGTS
jgi:hypothetical protein